MLREPMHLDIDGTFVIRRFERRLCRRNPDLGEASEGAVEAPSDVNEGVRAFLDKRPPKYQGR
jgi:hypothetical protein